MNVVLYNSEHLGNINDQGPVLGTCKEHGLVLSCIVNMKVACMNGVLYSAHLGNINVNEFVKGMCR